MKRYYTNDKRGELVEVDSILARELVRSGKRKPEDFQIEDLPVVAPATPRVETPFTNYGNRMNAQAMQPQMVLPGGGLAQASAVGVFADPVSPTSQGAFSPMPATLPTPAPVVARSVPVVDSAPVQMGAPAQEMAVRTTAMNTPGMTRGEIEQQAEREQVAADESEYQNYVADFGNKWEADKVNRSGRAILDSRLSDGSRAMTRDEFAKARAGFKAAGTPDDVTAIDRFFGQRGVYMPENLRATATRSPTLMQDIGGATEFASRAIMKPVIDAIPGNENGFSELSHASRTRRNYETLDRVAELRDAFAKGAVPTDEELQYLDENDPNLVVGTWRAVKETPGMLSRLVTNPEDRRQFLEGMATDLPLSLAVSGGASAVGDVLKTYAKARKAKNVLKAFEGRVTPVVMDGDRVVKRAFSVEDAARAHQRWVQSKDGLEAVDEMWQAARKRPSAVYGIIRETLGDGLADAMVETLHGNARGEQGGLIENLISGIPVDALPYLGINAGKRGIQRITDGPDNGLSRSEFDAARGNLELAPAARNQMRLPVVPGVGEMAGSTATRPQVEDAMRRPDLKGDLRMVADLARNPETANQRVRLSSERPSVSMDAARMEDAGYGAEGGERGVRGFNQPGKAYEYSRDADGKLVRTEKDQPTAFIGGDGNRGTIAHETIHGIENRIRKAGYADATGNSADARIVDMVDDWTERAYQWGKDNGVILPGPKELLTQAMTYRMGWGTDFDESIKALPVPDDLVQAFAERAGRPVQGEAGMRKGGTRMEDMPLPKADTWKPEPNAKPETVYAGGDEDLPFSFAGKNARNADQGALAEAERRLDAGEDRDAVRKSTGWFRGADGKMRFEVDDSKAKLKNESRDPENFADVWHEAEIRERGLPLGSVLDHPELFMAYPILQSFRVKVQNSGAHDGSFDPSSKTIYVKDPHDYRGMHETLKSVLLHEIQHAIQEQEGFARGGSERGMVNDYLDDKARLEELSRKILDRQNKYSDEARWASDELEAEAIQWAKSMGEFFDDIPTVEKVKEYLLSRDELYNDWYQEHADLKYTKIKSDPMDRYRRLAGETEARNTQTRRDLAADQRSESAPWDTQDVEDREQIVRFSLASEAGVPDTHKDRANVVEAARKAWAEKGVESPWFKRWFGDSKVVDSDGNPMVVYHGTDAEFNEFDFGKIGSNYNESKGTSNNPEDGGFFFTTRRSSADNFAGDDESKSRIIESYLNFKNPYVETVDDYWDAAHKLDNSLNFKELRRNGFDGAIIKSPNGSLLVAFSPTQIKSATGNRGTFDEGDADIRFSLDKVKVGDKLNKVAKEIDAVESEDLIPVVKGTTRSVQRSNFDSNSEAIADHLEAVNGVSAVDGRTVLIAHPERKSLFNRAKHLIGNLVNGERVPHAAKFKWVGAIETTLRDADVVAEGKKDGWSRVYYLKKYADGVHMVITNPKGVVVDQVPMEGLLSQYPKNMNSAKPFDDTFEVVYKKESPREGAFGSQSGEHLAGRRFAGTQTEDAPRSAHDDNLPKSPPDVKPLQFSLAKDDPRQKILTHMSKVLRSKGLLKSQNDLSTEWGAIPESAKNDPAKRQAYDQKWKEAEEALRSYVMDNQTTAREAGLNPPAEGHADDFDVQDAIWKFRDWTNASTESKFSPTEREHFHQARVAAQSGSKAAGHDEHGMSRRTLAGLAKTGNRKGGSILFESLGEGFTARSNGAGGWIVKHDKSGESFDVPRDGSVWIDGAQPVAAKYDGPEGPVPKEAGQNARAQHFGDNDLAGTEREDSARQVATRSIVDSLDDLTNLESRLKNKDASAYRAYDLAHGKTDYNARKAQERFLRPIMVLMKRHGFSQADVDSYLYAKHAKAVNAYVATINKDLPDGGSGMSNADADKILTDLKTDAVKWQGYEAIGALNNKLNDWRMDLEVKSGLRSEADAIKLRKEYPDYVPLRGLPNDETGRPGVGKGQTAKQDNKKRMGRKSKAENVLAQNFALTLDAIVNAERNIAARELWKMAGANPDPKYWAMDPAHTKPTLVTNKETGKKEVQQAFDRMARQAPGVVPLFIDGEAHYLEMKTPEGQRFAEAIKGLSSSQSNIALQYLGKANRMLASLITTYSPEFILTNLSRDALTAMIVSYGRDGAKVSANTMKGILPAMTAIWGNEAGVRTGHVKEWADWKERWEAAGGKVGFMQSMDFHELAKDVDTQLQDMGRSKYNPKKMAHTMVDLLDKANSGVESATRLSYFRALVENGMDEKKAAQKSKELTTNFNRRGDQKWLNQVYMFFNAAIQGTNNIYKLLSDKDPAVRKRARHMVGFLFGAGAGITMYNMMAGGEDENSGKAMYEKKAAFEKANQVVLMMPNGSGSAVTIPLPYGFNLFYNMGRLAVEGATRKDGYGGLDMASEMMSNAVAALNPVGVDLSPADMDASIATLATPSIVRPVAELARNKDFSGRPIAPDGKAGQPDSQKFNRGVNPLFKHTAALLNSSTGGDEFHPGGVDVSPESIEHVFNAYTGGLGRFMQQGTGIATTLAEGEDDVRIRQIPFLRRYFSEQRQGIDRGEFRNIMEGAKRDLDQLNAMAKKDDPETDKFVDDHYANVVASVAFGRLKSKETRLRFAEELGERFGESDLGDEYDVFFAKAWKAKQAMDRLQGRHNESTNDADRKELRKLIEKEAEKAFEGFGE